MTKSQLVQLAKIHGGESTLNVGKHLLGTVFLREKNSLLETHFVFCVRKSIADKKSVGSHTKLDDNDTGARSQLLFSSLIFLSD